MTDAWRRCIEWPGSVVRPELAGDLAGFILAVVIVHAERFILGVAQNFLTFRTSPSVRSRARVIP